MRKYLFQLLLILLICAVSFGIGMLIAQILHSANKNRIEFVSQPESPKSSLEMGATVKEITKEAYSLPAVEQSDSVVSLSENEEEIVNNTREKENETCRSAGFSSNLVGPRDNVPAGAPKDEGFSEFAIPVPGILGRSGRTSEKSLSWLKDQGWKGIVNVTLPGEHSGKDDDTLISGFSSMGFHYLSLPMASSSGPTQEQAKTFLNFVNDPANQPVLVHCAAGHRRAGTMTILYRYSVQGWSLEKAYQEYNLFTDSGINNKQKEFFKAWAAKYAPGSFACGS